MSAHKTKQVNEFLDRHRNVHLHFTPTYSSWLNQVELWFAQIERDVIGSLAPPLDAITRFLWSIRRRRHAPGDGPDEAGQFTGDRGSDDIGRFAAAGKRA